MDKMTNHLIIVAYFYCLLNVKAIYQRTVFTLITVELLWFNLEYKSTITTHRANSAEDKLIFLLFFPEHKIRHLIQIVSKDNEMSTPVFWEK